MTDRDPTRSGFSYIGYVLFIKFTKWSRHVAKNKVGDHRKIGLTGHERSMSPIMWILGRRERARRGRASRRLRSVRATR